MAKTGIPTEIAPDLLERLKERFATFPLTQDWELSIRKLEPGRAWMDLMPNVHTTNGPTGHLNGGVQATLADIACALALSTAFDGRMPFATSDLHIRYMDPATGPVTVEAGILRLSPRSAILEYRILCPSHVAALGTAHFTIKQRTKDPE